MDQRNFPFLAEVKTRIATTDEVKACKTYRQAVRAAWRMSGITNQRVLVEGTGMCAQHVSDYLNPDDKPTRRSLPASLIGVFEGFIRYTLVSQWIAAQSNLTVLEEMQAQRKAA